MIHTKKKLRMKQISESEISSRYLACPYCGSGPKQEDDWYGCCGESSDHFEQMIETLDGEVLVASEVVVIIDLLPTGDMNVRINHE